MQNSEQVLENTVQRCRERDIIIPTYREMADPSLVPDGIREELAEIGLWDLSGRMQAHSDFLKGKYAGVGVPSSDPFVRKANDSEGVATESVREGAFPSLRMAAPVSVRGKRCSASSRERSRQTARSNRASGTDAARANSAIRARAASRSCASCCCF